VRRSTWRGTGIARHRALKALVTALALLATAAHGVTIGLAELYRADGPSSWHHIAPARHVQSLSSRLPTSSEEKIIAHARDLQLHTAAAAIVLMDGDTVVYAWQRDESARAYWGASIGKSVLSMAVGQAICAGRLQLATKVREFVPEAAPFPVADATVRDLLRMAGGTTDETVNPETSSPWTPADNRALIQGSLTMPQLVLQPKLLAAHRGFMGVANPGGRFSYKSTDPVLLGIVLRRATGMAYGAWLEQAVFDPMGAQGGGWVEQDGEGNGLTSAGVRLPLPDWQRFALWVQRVSREQGCLGDYARQAMRVQIDNPGLPATRKFGPLFDGYGYFFWVRNRIAPGTTFASGLGGQRISWREGSGRMTIFFSTEENWMPRLYEIVRTWNAQ
jgi:CubicO group peptidase (beta-lactamase class C family)